MAGMTFFVLYCVGMILFPSLQQIPLVAHILRKYLKRYCSLLPLLYCLKSSDCSLFLFCALQDCEHSEVDSNGSTLQSEEGEPPSNSDNVQTGESGP